MADELGTNAIVVDENGLARIVNFKESQERDDYAKIGWRQAGIVVEYNPETRVALVNEEK